VGDFNYILEFRATDNAVPVAMVKTTKAASLAATKK